MTSGIACQWPIYTKPQQQLSPLTTCKQLRSSFVGAIFQLHQLFRKIMHNPESDTVRSSLLTTVRSAVASVRLQIMAVTVVVFAAGVATAKGEVTVVRDGTAAVPIVVFADAPPFTRQAADELAEIIGKISGVRPEVLEGLPNPVPESAIWVGFQPVLETLLPDIDFDFQYPEEILIAASNTHLVIAGRDRWDPDNMTARYVLPRSILEVDGIQLEYGTANAVYTFMQDFLGVRWFWPGENGEDIIPMETITFEPFEYRYHPQIRGRAGLFVYSQLESQTGHSQEWVRKQRLQLDSLRLDTSHAFRWWDRFSESNPEFFALQPNGTRVGPNVFPSERNVKMCKSNPGVWAQWLRDVEAELERNPHKTIFSAAANDGGAQGFCVCDDCRAWDHPDGAIVRYSWRGLSQNYVAVSDRQVTFANTLARMLREKYPDRDYYVTMMPYGNSRPAPVEAVPDDNVIVSAVFNFHNRNVMSRNELAESHRQMFLDWAKSGARNLAWRPNLGGGGGWQLGMPNVAPRRAIEDLRLVAENNVIALLFDAVWEHWATQGPHYYMLAQMAWNPYANGEAILQDYYQRAFGPAAELLTDYWELMDVSSDRIVMDGESARDVWNNAFFGTARAYLDEADELLAGAPPIYAERVAFVRAGLDYTQLYFETSELIDRLRASKGQDAEAEAAARANWVKLDKIFSDHPHAFDPIRIGTPSPRGGLQRMRRIHPDYYSR